MASPLLGLNTLQIHVVAAFSALLFYSHTGLECSTEFGEA